MDQLMKLRRDYLLFIRGLFRVSSILRGTVEILWICLSVHLENVWGFMLSPLSKSC